MNENPNKYNNLSIKVTNFEHNKKGLYRVHYTFAFNDNLNEFYKVYKDQLIDVESVVEIGKVYFIQSQRMNEHWYWTDVLPCTKEQAKLLYTCRDEFINRNQVIPDNLIKTGYCGHSPW